MRVYLQAIRDKTNRRMCDNTECSSPNVGTLACATTAMRLKLNCQESRPPCSLLTNVGAQVGLGCWVVVLCKQAGSFLAQRPRRRARYAEQ